MKSSRTINSCSFQKLCWNSNDTGNIVHHIETKILPYSHDDNHIKRQFRCTKPAPVKNIPTGHSVKSFKARTKDEFPDQADCSQTNDIGHIIERTSHAVHFILTSHDDCHSQREQVNDDYIEYRKFQSKTDTFPEKSVMSKNLDIVVQSDKCHGLSYTVPIKHRIIQVHYKRDIRSKQNKRNCRENKQRKDRQLLCLLVVLQIHPLLKSFFSECYYNKRGYRMSYHPCNPHPCQSQYRMPELRELLCSRAIRRHPLCLKNLLITMSR